MKALTIFSGAIAGLMIILVGTFIPTAILIPKLSSLPYIFALKTSWQVPSVLLCAIVCGPNSASIASIAYLTIGLFFIPIFHGGGSIGYLLTPDFGYLAGFIPASIITGEMSKHLKTTNLISFTKIAIIGVVIIQITGIINIIIGAIGSRWNENMGDLLFSYTLAPLPKQLFICPAIAILSILIKKILFKK